MSTTKLIVPAPRRARAEHGRRGLDESVTSRSFGSISFFFWIVQIVVLGACSAAPPAPAKPVSTAPAPAARGGLPPLSEGRCGGFGELVTGKSTPLLGDRVRVAALDGAMELERERRIEQMLSASDDDWWILGHGKEQLRVHAAETYRRPGHDLFEAIRAQGGGAVATVHGDGGEIVVRVPEAPKQSADAPDGERPRAPLLEAYVETVDGMVVKLAFWVSDEASKSGGCERVALKLVETAKRGSRALELPSGDQVLVPGVAALIPAGYALTSNDMAHWYEVHVHPIVDMDQPEPFMMIRFDDHPGRPELTDLPWRTVAAPAYGQPAEWREWKDKKGRQWRDVVVSKGRRKVLIAIAAGDPRMVDSLTEIAGSIGDREVKRSLPSCAAARPLAPPSPPRVDEPLKTLLTARRFALDADVFGAPRPPELDAFRTVAMRPDDERAQAFRYVAENGTPAGRLYGLAGLYVAAPAMFEPVLCAARNKITGSIDVGLSCGAKSRSAAELLDASDLSAPRSDGSAAARDGMRDIRGGGLARAVWIQAIRGKPSVLGRDGYVPPVVPGVPAPAPLRNGARPAKPVIAHMNGGMCWVREADGRVVCSGEVLPLTAEARKAGSVILPPDMVRYPADLALSDDKSLCVLDVDGRRACLGSISRTLATREERCAVPAPSQMAYRVFDDGPWSRLVVLHDICAIRQSDGALYCFDGREDGSNDLAAAAAEGQGHYRAYRVAVEGRVTGAGTGREWDGPHYVFTDDGALWEWKVGRAPKVIRRFDAPIERYDLVAGTDFVTLRGGRVFARGIAEGADPFGEGNTQQHPEWIEVKGLQNARIRSAPTHSGALGCAIEADGQVACWQINEECSHQGDTCKPLGRQSFAFLQRSTDVLIEPFYTCGRRSGSRLTCDGEGVRWVFGKAAKKGGMQVDLAKLGESAQEYTLPAPPPLPPEVLKQIRSQSTLGPL